MKSISDIVLNDIDLLNDNLIFIVIHLLLLFVILFFLFFLILIIIFRLVIITRFQNANLFEFRSGLNWNHNCCMLGLLLLRLTWYLRFGVWTWKSFSNLFFNLSLLSRRMSRCRIMRSTLSYDLTFILNSTISI